MTDLETLTEHLAAHFEATIVEPESKLWRVRWLEWEHNRLRVEEVEHRFQIVISYSDPRAGIHDRIFVSQTKRPEVILRDIERRLLPKYLQAVETYQALLATQAEDERQLEERWAAIFAQLEGTKTTVQKSWQGVTVARTHLPEDWGGIDWSAQASDGRWFEVRISFLLPEKAVELAKYIAEHMAEKGELAGAS